MSSNSVNTVLVLGGAGFIGSNIVKRFHQAGYDISVIDGLMEKTGGSRENLEGLISHINFINSKICDVKNLNEIIDKNDIVIDCMAWTSHLLAIEDPVYDLKLNTESHLNLLQCLRGKSDKKVIYLGSRVQYGNPSTGVITEDTPMIPEDIQGIHKLAADSYFRLYAKAGGLNVVSIRFPNCFGENQPVKGDDIGLVGGLIRDILDNKKIDVFGHGRKRNLVYVKNLSEAVFQVSNKKCPGYSAFNLSGHEISIEDLVRMLIKIIGKGRYEVKPLPPEIKNIDTGNAKFNDDRLREFLGGIPISNLKDAMGATAAYFKWRRG